LHFCLYIELQEDKFGIDKSYDYTNSWYPIFSGWYIVYKELLYEEERAIRSLVKNLEYLQILSKEAA
jgi:hypothetical protein